MKLKTTLSLVLCTLLLLLCSSCVWSTTPLPPDQIPPKDEPIDERGDGTDTSDDASFLDKSLSDHTELGDNLQFFHTPSDDCVIVYNTENAWAFDKKLNKVTKLTDFDSMYAVADTHGHAKEYFDSYTLDVECVMRSEGEIRTVFTVSSNIADASYTVYAFYTLDNNSLSERGEVRGYYYEALKYPGSENAVTITDIEDFNLLINSSEYDYKESYLYRAIKALVEVDVPELEAVMNVKEGTLAEWESVVISDYSITNENPLEPYIDALTLTLNITESSVERYPVGTHTINIYDGPGPVYSPVFDYPDASLFGRAEQLINTWATRFGGSFAIERQTLKDSAYAHQVIDFYMVQETEAPTLERFERFCKETFGYTLEGSGIDRNSVENHGGHGGSSVLCDITSTVSAGENYIIEVTFYADQLKSVVSKVYRYHVSDYMDGPCVIDSCESVYDSGFKTIGWSN